MEDVEGFVLFNAGDDVVIFHDEEGFVEPSDTEIDGIRDGDESA